MNLYAIYLGGRAESCSIELHDVIFTVGKSIESLYPTILDKWFGKKDKCHLDSWISLEQIDNYAVSLSTEKPQDQAESLYFINLGAYEEGSFTELHAIEFIIASTELEAKKRAKQSLLVGKDQVHTDDLYDVDDCIRLDQIDGYYIHLTQNDAGHEFKPHNAYHKIPKEVVATYIANQKQT